MSKTYRRRKTKRPNRNIHSVWAYSDFQIINDEDFCYLDKWNSFSSTDSNQIAKMALSYYHSDNYKSRHSRAYKKVLIKDRNKMLRSNGKKKLGRYIHSNCFEYFDEVIFHKPKDIMWELD